MLPLQNYNCSIFSAHKPSVILARAEAAELEIVNTPKQTWLRIELQKHKGAACWHGNRRGLKQQELESRSVCLKCVWVRFWRPWKTALQINSSDSQSKTGAKETSLSNLAIWKRFLPVDSHDAIYLCVPKFI